MNVSLYEFLLVISPAEHIYEDIMQVKKSFAAEFEAPHAAFSQPHITLASFVQFALAASKIVRLFKSAAIGTTPFKIELADFGSFPAHTIYMNITTKNEIRQLVKTVRTKAQSLMKIDKDHKPLFIMEPHLTIARKLAPWQYEKGWLKYQHQHYSGSFMAEKMLLLQRRQGEKAYKISQTFLFEGQKQAVVQTMLF